MLSALNREIETIRAGGKGRGGVSLATLEERIAALERPRTMRPGRPPAFGYHSALSATPAATRWVQVDLGRSTAITRVVLHACDDDFNHIGPGFGFPVRFRIKASDDPRFTVGVSMITDQSSDNFANPRFAPVNFEVQRISARYVRETARRLALLQNDYNFALPELEIFDPDPEALDISKEAAYIQKLYGLDHGQSSFDRQINVVEEIDAFDRKCLVARATLGARRAIRPGLVG